MMENKSLFWYGWRANLKKGFGGVVVIFGLILLWVHWILTVIVVGLGVYLIATSLSQRFDYQRQSGNIIHQGDWR